MILILFPCSVRRPFIYIDHNVNRSFFAQAFRENNIEIRNKLFTDPFIKHLWVNIFLETCPEVVVAHLRRIRSCSDQGELKYEKFINDVKQLEVTCFIKILPDIASNEDNVKIFTQEENDADYIENIKYNKKQGKERLALIELRQNSQVEADNN